MEKAEVRSSIKALTKRLKQLGKALAVEEKNMEEPEMMADYDFSRELAASIEKEINDIGGTLKILLDYEKKEINDGVFIIQKEGFVDNSLMWWRKGGNGYTTNINEAEEFNDDASQKIVGRANSNKIRHKKSDVIDAAEIHVDGSGKKWNDYLNRK